MGAIAGQNGNRRIALREDSPFNFWILLLCLTLVGTFIAGCERKDPLVIGFVGGLTGRVADLGIAGRDAVTLAVEQVNRQGGIGGRNLLLLVRDDKQGREQGRQAVSELLDAGAVALIGPMTSQVAVDTVDLVQQAGRVMIGPTIKTDQLSGLDDHFMRVTTALDRDARSLAGLLAGRGERRVAVVYDLANRAFSEGWLKHFSRALAMAEGEVTPFSFVSADQMPMQILAQRAMRGRPDAILIVANALDTAMFSQQAYKLKNSIPLYGTAWAFTSTEIIKQGGKGVENLCAFQDFDVDSRKPAYLTFRQEFQKRFGHEPVFAAVLAYDAAQLLLEGLRKDPHPEQLRETLLSLGTINGLQTPFRLDGNGDVEREQFLVGVREGTFQRMP